MRSTPGPKIASNFEQLYRVILSDVSKSVLKTIKNHSILHNFWQLWAILSDLGENELM